MLPGLGVETETPSVTQSKTRNVSKSTCVARESCFRVNPQPASLVIKVKGSRQINIQVSMVREAVATPTF